MRKIILFFLTAGCLAILVWFFFIQETYRNPFASIQPIEAIPNSASIILEFDDYFLLRHRIAKMPYSMEMSDVFFVKKMSDDFKNIRQLFSKNTNHRKLLINSPVTASLHLSGNQDIDFLYVIEDQADVFELKELLEEFSHQEFNAKRNQVYKIKITDEINYTIAYYGDVLLISKYSYLVEKGMQQLKSPKTNLLTHKDLVFGKSKGENESKIYVTLLLENLGGLIRPFLNKKTPEYVATLSQYFNSSQLTLTFEEEGIEINGEMKANLDKGFFNDFFKNNRITNSNIQEVLPETVAYFFKNNNLPSDEMEQEVFNEYFMPWISEEWVVGRTDIFTRKMKAEKFLALPFKNLKMAQYHLEEFSNEVGILKEWNYQTYPIRQIVTDYLPLPFSKGKGVEMKNPCYTFIEDYVVFAGSGRILENWVDQILTGQTLARHLPYLKMKSRAGKNQTSEFYWNSRTASKFFEISLASKDKQTQTQIQKWENFPALGINGHWKKNQLNVNGYLFFQKEKEQKTMVKWRAPLGSEAVTPPFSIYNEEEQAYNILVQDADHRLYLIDSEGEERWNILLDQPIVSKIWTINYSASESAGILFNTANQIYLMDLEGKPRNEFPIKLASPATNGVLLAEFGDEDLGIFIACENNQFYGFDKNGIPLPGWQSVEYRNKITEPLQHFQTKDEDFILAFTNDGSVISYGKDGFERMVANNITMYSQSPLCFQAKDENQIVVADKKGIPQFLNLSGESRSLLQKGKVKQYNYIFAADDLAGDRLTDFVAIKNNELQIFYQYQDGFQQFGKFQFSNPPNAVFTVKTKEMGKAMIGSLCQKQGQVYLFDKKGNLHPDFPLAGTTKFELVNLFSENKNAVLVADNDEVIAYELP